MKTINTLNPQTLLPKGEIFKIAPRLLLQRFESLNDAEKLEILMLVGSGQLPDKAICQTIFSELIWCLRDGCIYALRDGSMMRVIDPEVATDMTGKDLPTGTLLAVYTFDFIRPPEGLVLFADPDDVEGSDAPFIPGHSVELVVEP